jgi:hypothetical protein
MEGHRLAHTVVYGHLSNDNSPSITPVNEQQADTVIEIQLEKAGIGLAYLLNAYLMSTLRVLNSGPRHAAVNDCQLA